jgi:Uma2 family endonuclease
MATLLKLGPADHGRRLTLDEFLSGDYQEGHRYELIEGRLYVSPEANLPAGFLERWISRVLDRYVEERPDVINFSWVKTRVFVPGEEEVSAPEPDAAAYAGFPLDIPISEMRWQDVSPILVVEVLDADNPDKDLVRNVRLYRLVESIREYRVVDPRPDPDRPALIVRRRSGARWRVSRHEYGSAYATPLLPGLELVVDPRG